MQCFKQAGIEPSLEELLQDPMTGLIMRRDRSNRRKVAEVVHRAANVADCALQQAA